MIVELSGKESLEKNMACAGYLVLNFTRVVYVVIDNGVLTCQDHREDSAPCQVSAKNAVLTSCDHDDAIVRSNRPQEESTQGDQCTTKPYADAVCPSLPLLDLRAVRSQISTDVGKYAKPNGAGKRRMSWQKSEENDENEDPKCVRQLRLSGYEVEFSDHQERDSDSRWLLPYSFQIRTFKTSVHPDETQTSSFVDSILLSAIDEATQQQWIKRIKRWHRYAWRELYLIKADEGDREQLQAHVDAAMLQNHDERTTDLLRSTRRRFYRSMTTTLLPPLMAPALAPAPLAEAAATIQYLTS